MVLRAIFSLPYAAAFVFKGGTSLSKGWGLIERFSEDTVAHRKKFTAWSGLDYTTHLPNTISFLPQKNIEDILQDDYKQMKIGFIYANTPSFDEIMERLSELQNRFRTLEWKNNR